MLQGVRLPAGSGDKQKFLRRPARADLRDDESHSSSGPVLRAARATFSAPLVQWFALLFLCAAYLQGAFDKAADFSSAVAEMNHFGLKPAAPFAAATIAFELGASVMVLIGFYRWLAALGLAGFTLFATLVANRFWELAAPERLMAANAFFEHWGLIGGFLLVACHDLRRNVNRGNPTR